MIDVVYNGKDEIYTDFFICSGCGYSNVVVGADYCGGCGEKINHNSKGFTEYFFELRNIKGTNKYNKTMDFGVDSFYFATEKRDGKIVYNKRRTSDVPVSIDIYLTANSFDDAVERFHELVKAHNIYLKEE